ncbi:L-lysine exporter family protein LysE/ArgO [Thalassovita litoralis]|jgi:L-lysine exporter family protein LysE/ArgO|uniref:L-lysine exporter family protein LysE/ArgO n=1 Tax=Thalassovita litoralis TaxID=1010611 RepID=A0A521DMC4_9RHOB|nr:LysE/ArgO family amino acid transporter [Thalassovita litoralis]SMO72221.1 L-lysine exporter family protein LysE/ArgO [Thalassovita litoralis]
METALAGFGLGLSLILAIGAQNAFVLRQGLRQEHVFAVCLTCALSDAILIAAGVSGFGILVTKLPWLEPVMRWGGAAFLIVYGARAFWAAWKGGGHLDAAGQGRASLKGVLLTCLLLTWANPHVYLDTVVLLGSVAAQYPAKVNFALGAMTASFAFFFSLGYGARLLAPLFARPAAWRLLDVLVGAIMWTVAGSLLL